jgi:hypothetical protein
MFLLFYLKRSPVYVSKHNVSETGFCLRLQVKPTQLGPIDVARTMDNVQKYNIPTNIPSSQTFRSYSGICKHVCILLSVLTPWKTLHKTRS